MENSALSFQEFEKCCIICIGKALMLCSGENCGTLCKQCFSNLTGHKNFYFSRNISWITIIECTGGNEEVTK